MKLESGRMDLLACLKERLYVAHMDLETGGEVLDLNSGRDLTLLYEHAFGGAGNMGPLESKAARAYVDSYRKLR